LHSGCCAEGCLRPKSERHVFTVPQLRRPEDCRAVVCGGGTVPRGVKSDVSWLMAHPREPRLTHDSVERASCIRVTLAVTERRMRLPSAPVVERLVSPNAERQTPNDALLPARFRLSTPCFSLAHNLRDWLQSR
jgi:hypothetical protein